MKHFVENIFLGDYLVAQEDIVERIEQIVADKLSSLQETILEGNIQRMGRTKLVRIRIRKGKVQRRVKKSAVPGYTIRGGKMIRMSAIERRHRKMAARRSKFKRRAKMKQSLRKRRMSLRRRTAMGL